MSALFGARYTRQIKDRLGLEADLTVAPGHEIETRGSGCIGDLCFGEGDSRDFEDAARASAVGWPSAAATSTPGTTARGSPTSCRAATCGRS